MKSFKLSIPQRNSNPAVTINPSLDQIKAILRGLPLANPEKCCTLILQELFRLNRAPFAVKARIEIMALLLPMLDDMINSVRQSYIHDALPLSNRRQQSAQLVKRLLTEMSYGYKIIVHELLEESGASTASLAHLPQAIYYAMGFLARLLVDSYALYVPEPKQIWLELNQLYLYAEKHQLHDIELNPINAEHEPHPATIINSYRRIMLLAIANPYHLMQGETVKLYKKLVEWAPHCRILSLGTGRLPEGKLFIDLTVDAPPLYAPKTPSKLRPVEGRLLEIKELLALISQETRRLTLAKQKDSLSHNLGRRMERDMYFRWADAWGLRRERLSNRKPLEAPARMICGLTATHHFVSGEIPFKPEETEVQIHGHDAHSSRGSSLALIAEEHTPWAFEDQQKHALSTLHQPRKSQFDAHQGAHDRNLWIKVYANSIQAIDEFTGGESTHFDYHGCNITNTNQGGFGVVCPLSTQLPARVGDLIGARTERSSDWAIGKVLWMKINSDQNVSLGIKLIAEDARAVAIKAVQGVGCGSEYYRGLLLPNLDPKKHPTTLITPAAVYDVGSVLKLILEDEMLHARLLRQLTATSSFSHYQFELVAQPSTEKKDLTHDQEEKLSSRLIR
jgi:hypothetical protein